ncbi:PTS sugar transporter subunit IIA [Halalkalibacterium halodurans]|uniref:BH0221 protein n=1 Tax=Halalkalibacterium halodurans (strain ATCC BAA-125 / DSM 18197 / FERM 7344 / JCM 9153 / C-125) TaxID=272558 RepID=Q9KG91_HALH5|nr:PTS sugar transporter subunit IIA [Halalkalibacterium halodurans]MED4171670.1 PTS sugar transporter subunit IIA [Halalkalibacterium halodurans]BAB03940.1 BH0221 [Halalkalibacterium halodurans C-125]
MKFLEEPLVAFDLEASSPEEAIRKTGKLLVGNQLVEDEYVEAMVRSYQKNGPYFVVAPNIALPHARPEDGVKEAAVAFVRLKRPISFGHSSNDPVRFVFALAAASSGEHLQVLQKLMQLLGNRENIARLANVSDYKGIDQLLGGDAS